MSEGYQIDCDLMIDPKKVVTVGDMGVGKTSIINAIKGEEFSSEVVSTIGASYVQCSFPVDNGTLLMNFWDTAGQERFHSLIPLYLRNADACVIVFDVTREENLKMLDSLYDNIKSATTQPQFFIVCANKMDLVDPDTPLGSYQDWAKERNMEFISTSAKTGLNIDILYRRIATKLAENTHHKEYLERQIPQNDKKRSCC